MLDNFWDIINNACSKTKKFLEKHKKLFFYFFILVAVTDLTLTLFDVSIPSLEEFFKVQSQDSSNIFNLLVKGDLLYVF